MPAAFILVGAALLAAFHWTIYLFGAALVLLGLKMLFRQADEVHPDRNPLYRLFKRFFPAVDGYRGSCFVVRENGHWLATPLLLVLISVEATDVVFAVDSIPAIFAITRDPFIVYTSNIFAILGLRALFFLLAGAIGNLHYLKTGLALVLAFVGVKMLITDVYKIPISASLAAVACLIGGAVVASLLGRHSLTGPDIGHGSDCPAPTSGIHTITSRTAEIPVAARASNTPE